MKPFTLPAMIVLALSLAPGCAPDDAPAAPTALVEGRWTLRSADAISTSPQRAVVGLFYGQDHSVEDIAATLAMNENTVKTHLARARTLLREAWLRESGGAS